MTDLDGLFFVMRGNDDTVVDHPTVQARLHVPPDAAFSRPESPRMRTLSDGPDVPVGTTGCRCRVVVAPHLAPEKKSRIGQTRTGVVSERFFTQLPHEGFTASDVVALSLHRGACEPMLAEDDDDQDPDRGCRHAPAGQEAWHIVSPWIWNVRRDLGHQREPTALRTPACAPAIPSVPPYTAPPSGSAPPQVGVPWKADRFSGHDVPLQPDGTLRCPAAQKRPAHEQRREADGSLLVVSAASIRRCRPCLVREPCQWNGRPTAKPRQVRVLLHPLPVGSPPLFWRDWSRRQHRRACMHLRSPQHVEIQVDQSRSPAPEKQAVVLSRAQRAHARLSWQERLTRNARAPGASRVRITLVGVPDAFTTSLGLLTMSPSVGDLWMPSPGNGVRLRATSSAFFSSVSLFRRSFWLLFPSDCRISSLQGPVLGG